MFDDLKKDQAGQSQPNSGQTLGSIDDMFADIDPAPRSQPASSPAPTPTFSTSGQTQPITERPSAVQSGKIKPISPNQNFNLPNEARSMPNSFTPPSQSISSVPVMSTSRKMTIIFSVFVLVLAVAGGAYYLFFKDKIGVSYQEENQNANININNNENLNINQNNNINTNQNVNNIIIDDSMLDDDFDGLTNAEEEALGTNPYEPDTDNDGVFDWDEVRVYDTNPLLADSDSDGLGDFEEIMVFGTDPNNPDSDGDGYLDGTEVQNGYNPLGSGLLEDMPALPPRNLNTNENNQ